ncbi:hypothetical protein ZIOFF_071172 [Zingiber officinale]|uniref:CRAL-TRIO domain-containing protein n=1 Tax=Zingiber officinale TaxID=94328 RepID=A0A8J5EQA8_ZINOF|nr:hypothetical protein ZIOFF_071172 [Zingiber officinale]
MAESRGYEEEAVKMAESRGREEEVARPKVETTKRAARKEAAKRMVRREAAKRAVRREAAKKAVKRVVRREATKRAINEVRASLGSLPDKLRLYASDVSIARYLTARNWNVQKATKMLKETLKWRLEYEPEKIHWNILERYFIMSGFEISRKFVKILQYVIQDEIASEAETGKIYRTSFSDKLGRSILVMRPRCENSKSIKGKIRYLVYCMENAILNLPSDQEQMVWLIDFKGFDLSNISIRTTKATADVLQNHYPERLGLAILYNPPKFFEPFWNIAKHLLEPKTYRKVKFVYPNDDNSKMIMEEFFNMDELDCAFGGNSQVGFNINDYAARMRDDEQRMPFFWCQENGSSPEKSATLDDNFSAGNCESEPDSRGTTENGVVGSSNTIGTSLP